MCITVSEKSFEALTQIVDSRAAPFAAKNFINCQKYLVNVVAIYVTLNISVNSADDKGLSLDS